MSTSQRPPKKPYTAPRLRCYGNLRKLTGGVRKDKTEAQANAIGSKTRLGAPDN